MSKFKKKDITFDAQIDITKSYQDDQENWYMEGYATTSDYDMQGDILSQEAIKGAENDLLEYSTVLYNHDTDVPIGLVKESVAKEDGLWIKIMISKTVPDIWQKIQEGVLSKFSIRGQILEEMKEKVMHEGKEIWASIVKAVKLIEVSVVSLPANPKARALSWYMAKALDDNNRDNVSINLTEHELCELMLAAKRAGIDIKTKSFYSEDIEDIIKDISSKGFLDDWFAPRTTMNCHGKQIEGLTDRKIGEEISGNFTGKMVALYSDEEYGASGSINIENGKLMEVTKAMADIKKSDGTICTQEDLDALEVKVKGLEETATVVETPAEETPVEETPAEEASVEETPAEETPVEETPAEETPVEETPAEQVPAEEVPAEEVPAEETEAAKALAEENIKLKKENEKLLNDKKEMEVNAEVEKKWEVLKGSAYEEKDEETIKSILKKSAMGQVLTAEDTDNLINKKIRGSILKLGFDDSENVGELTEERKQELTKIGGIRITKR